jgi:hypothetical protein
VITKKKKRKDKKLNMGLCPDRGIRWLTRVDATLKFSMFTVSEAALAQPPAHLDLANRHAAFHWPN